MILTLPESPQAIADATWADLEPYYTALETAPMDNPREWLREWSSLEEIIEEAGTLALIAYTCDTTNAAKEAAHLRWSSEIFPKAVEMQVKLAKRLVESGYSERGLETTLRGFRTLAANGGKALPVGSEYPDRFLVTRGIHEGKKVAGQARMTQREEDPAPLLAPFD